MKSGLKLLLVLGVASAVAIPFFPILWRSTNRDAVKNSGRAIELKPTGGDEIASEYASGFRYEQLPIYGWGEGSANEAAESLSRSVGVPIDDDSINQFDCDYLLVHVHAQGNGLVASGRLGKHSMGLESLQMCLHSAFDSLRREMSGNPVGVLATSDTGKWTSKDQLDALEMLIDPRIRIFFVAGK